MLEEIVSYIFPEHFKGLARRVKEICFGSNITDWVQDVHDYGRELSKVFGGDYKRISFNQLLRICEEKGWEEFYLKITNLNTRDEDINRYFAYTSSKILSSLLGSSTELGVINKELYSETLLQLRQTLNDLFFLDFLYKNKFFNKRKTSKNAMSFIDVYSNKLNELKERYYFIKQKPQKSINNDLLLSIIELNRNYNTNHQRRKISKVWEKYEEEYKNARRMLIKSGARFDEAYLRVLRSMIEFGKQSLLSDLYEYLSARFNLTLEPTVLNKKILDECNKVIEIKHGKFTEYIKKIDAYAPLMKVSGFVLQCLLYNSFKPWEKAVFFNPFNVMQRAPSPLLDSFSDSENALLNEVLDLVNVSLEDLLSGDVALSRATKSNDLVSYF